MRRLITTTIIMALLMAATVPGVVAADDDTAMMAEHPVVGVWQLDSAPDDPANPMTTSFFAPDGAAVNTNVQNGMPEVSIGAWTPTGERTGHTTVPFHVLAPDGQFAGYGTFRAAFEVAEDGQSLVSTFTVELPAGPGGETTGQLGPGTAVGTRVVVEAPGEPVAPLGPPPE